MRPLSAGQTERQSGAAEPIVSALTTAGGSPHHAVVGTGPAGSVAAMAPPGSPTPNTTSTAEAQCSPPANGSGEQAGDHAGSSSPADGQRQGRGARLHLAAAIGNGLEWFDFAVYGYFATDLGRLFFPRSDATLQLIASFAVFAIGYLMRPVGSLLLGPVGDLLGRRTMLITSVLVMGSCSLLIGLLPAAPTWAPWAGYGLLALRMLQGLSVGGEYTGALTVVLENGESERRCWRAAVASAGSIVGFVAGAAAAALIYSRLPPAEVLAWGWRLPFLAGAAVALLAFWLRRVELPAEERGQLHSGPAALLAGLWQERGVVLRVMAALAFADVAFYMVLVFEPQLALERRPELAGAISTITAVNEAIGVALVLLGGWLSDRVGPQRCMRWGCISLGLVLPAACLAMQAGNLSGLALGQLLAVLPLMLVCGAFPALLPAQFAPAQRCTAFSLAYSLVVALVGGTAPLLGSWMVLERGWSLGPPLYTLLWLPACLWAVGRFRGWEAHSAAG